MDSPGIYIDTDRVTDNEDVIIAKCLSEFGQSVLLHHYSPWVPFRVVFNK